MTDYLLQRNPFKTDKDLRSITSGVVSLNFDSTADQAKQIGEKIVITMARKKVHEFSFKKKDAVVPMNDKSAFKVDEDTIKIDPQLLLQRLLSAAIRMKDESDLPLEFELCTHPPALFESSRQMREADKPALANAMKSADNPSPITADLEDKCHVVDGGMLLQWIPCENGQTFEEMCCTYVQFVKKRYQHCIVVFDGYDQWSNTKYSTHGRRTAEVIGTEVRFTRARTFRGKKQTFLANHENKQLFINMLSQTMNIEDIEISNAAADADLLNVLTAVGCSMTKPTILVGDETDLLVLLFYHSQLMSHPIYLQPRPKLNRDICLDIHKLQEYLGIDVWRNILFIYTILGCDTTSKVYGLGKGTSLKAFKHSEVFHQSLSLFISPPTEVAKEQIIRSKEQALVYLYKGRNGQTLDNLRMNKFVEKVAKSTIYVDPKQLPPTFDAAYFHSLRVYLQVQDSKGEVVLNPLNWGWELIGDRLFLVTTTKGPAPAHIFKVVRCTCSSGCKTKACSCKKKTWH